MPTGLVDLFVYPEHGYSAGAIIYHSSFIINLITGQQPSSSFPSGAPHARLRCTVVPAQCGFLLGTINLLS